MIKVKRQYVEWKKIVVSQFEECMVSKQQFGGKAKLWDFEELLYYMFQFTSYIILSIIEFF